MDEITPQNSALVEQNVPPGHDGSQSWRSTKAGLDERKNRMGGAIAREASGRHGSAREVGRDRPDASRAML
jgi:hypothetical protein